MERKNNDRKNKVVPSFVFLGGGVAAEVAVTVGGRGGRGCGGRRETDDRFSTTRWWRRISGTDVGAGSATTRERERAMAAAADMETADREGKTKWANVGHDLCFCCVVGRLLEER